MRWKWADMCGIIWTSLLCVSKRAFIRSLVSIVGIIEYYHDGDNYSNERGSYIKCAYNIIWKPL